MSQGNRKTVRKYAYPFEVRVPVGKTIKVGDEILGGRVHSITSVTVDSSRIVIVKGKYKEE